MSYKRELLPHRVLFDCECLLQEIGEKYPEGLAETLEFLLNTLEFYKENKTQKSIEQEYVVFEELRETTNG